MGLLISDNFVVQLFREDLVALKRAENVIGWLEHCLQLLSDCMSGFGVSRSMLSYSTLGVNGVAGSISSKVGMESAETTDDVDVAVDAGAPLDDVEG